MSTYSYRTPGAILSGSGSIKETGTALSELGVKKPAIVCDKGIEKAGIAGKVADVIKSAGYSVDIIAEAEPEPRASTINEIVPEIRSGGFDCLIGLGGGSSLDSAKLLSVLSVLQGETDVRDFLGIDLVQKPGLSTLMIPTTAGTGSEVTPNAIVSLPDEGRKAGAVSRHLVPDMAILDPELTLGLPPDATAATGLDALIHCLESYISKKANVLADGYSLQGLTLISSSLREAYHHGNDIAAREKMLIGACYGGMALTASGTAAVHALAYSTGAKYHIPHGVANSMLLVPVLERSMDMCEERLIEAGAAMGVQPNAKAVLDYLRELADELGIPKSLDTYGYKDSDLEELVVAASKVTRLLDNNPKSFSLDDIRDIFIAISKA